MSLNLKDEILNADMVLVGIGEEFEIKKSDIEKSEKYLNLLNKCGNNEQLFSYLMKDFIENSNEEAVLRRKQCYRKLCDLIKNKNYFIVSLCTDGIIHEAGLDEERIVEPCGTLSKMQCCNKCTTELYEPNSQMMEKIMTGMTDKDADKRSELPICPKCGKVLVFNNIMAENYVEEGYLDKWQKYTKWLQGTVNRKVCILELGVGMRFPTVIRWPFEKVAYFNQKSVFLRIHSKLYQVTEEIKDRSIGVEVQPLDFLMDL